MSEQYRKELKAWADTKSSTVQGLVEKYPPGLYMMKEDAPYGISCPGTKVTLSGYTDEGSIIVVVDAKDKRPEALAHEILLGNEFNRTDEDMEKIHAANISVVIDPQWIELIETTESAIERMAKDESIVKSKITIRDYIIGKDSEE